MILVKVLEKKNVIRAFGVCLVLAPIINTLVKMSLLPELKNRWTLEIFWKIIRVGSTFNQILYVATLVIGFIMLRGNANAWKAALMLLAGYIALQISDFSHVKTNSITWLFFITNILVFLFIADQLVWKVKAAPLSATVQKPTPALTPAPNTILTPVLTPVQTSVPIPLSPRAPAQLRKRILIQFTDKGPWAQLLGISSKGLHVKCLTEPPANIKNRELEISLKNGLTLKTRFARNINQDYYFDYIELSTENKRSLNQWIRSQSKAA